MNKKVKSFYFRVLKSSSSHSDIQMTSKELIDLMSSIMTSTYDDRTISISGSNRMMIFNNDSGGAFTVPNYEDFIVGAFVNYREGISMPLLASKSDKINFRAIDKANDESITEMMFFMISKATGTVMIVPSRFAGNESSIETYLNDYIANNGIVIDCKGETTSMINLAPIISEDATNRLRKINCVKTFEYHCVKPVIKTKSAEAAIENPMLPLIDSDFQADAGFSRVNYKFTAKKQDKLSGAKLVSWIRKLIYGGGMNVTVCRVTGADNSSETSVVDFLNNVYMSMLLVPVEDGQKTYKYETLLETMHSAFKKKDEEFKKILS